MQRIVRFSWLAICAMSASASWLSDVEKTVHRWLDHLEHQFHGPYVGHHHRCPDGGKVRMSCANQATAAWNPSCISLVFLEMAQ